MAMNRSVEAKWLHEQVSAWKLTRREQEIAGELVRELLSRSEFLLDVGLEYLSLSRPANSAAYLLNSKVATPTFNPDVAGVYVATLIVNDGKLDSLPSTVMITAQ